MKLDNSIKDLAERQKIVDQALIETPNPSPAYLEALANYLVFCLSPEEKKSKEQLTGNRKTTIYKRETSYETLSEKFENGEDGIYQILSNEKNTIFRHKIKITDEERAKFPEINQATDAAKYWEQVLKTAEGPAKGKAQKFLIEARQNQYSIRSNVNQPVARGGSKTKNPKYIYNIKFDGYITFDKNGYCVSHGVTLVDPQVCMAILHNYEELENAAAKNMTSDLWFLMDEFKNVLNKALINEPLYRAIIEDKWHNLQNIEIQEDLMQRFGTTHSLEYISSLWCKKIPELIASQAEDDYLDWYYTEIERGKWKRCSRCGKIKLAHNKYFSRNTTSKDSFYSICKECRNLPNQGRDLVEKGILPGSNRGRTSKKGE